MWPDLEGNTVDYDVVFELGGTDDKIGEIVAAFETFWRRGIRHSKDKARDDSGKLGAIRDTYPTARMLCIYAAGDFSKPAKDLVKSRGLELFYIPKRDILEVWEENGVTIDYPDKADETSKAELADLAAKALRQDTDLLQRIADSLWDRLGATEKTRMTDVVRARLSALPRNYTIDVVDFVHLEFASRIAVQEFIDRGEFLQQVGDTHREYRYTVEFGDGDVFERSGLSWIELRQLHKNLGRLVKHVERLSQRALK